MRFTGVFLDITERKKAEEQQTLLMREVDHRAKNLLAVVQSMLNLSKAETTAEFITAVSGRIKALSLAHTLLSESRWQGVELERLVEEETAPFEGQKVPRIRFEGPPVSLQPAAAQCLAVTLHELITNAAKYGALSSSTGLVTLEWELRAEGLVLHWVERGGPPVSPPTRRGFGTKAMTASIEQQLGGRLNLDWRPDGLRLQLSIPKESFLALDRPQAASRPAQPGVGVLPPTLAAGSRILLVEDEALIGAMFKQLLSDLGFEVVGPIASLDQAVAAAHGEDVQGAILDVNLGGTPIYPVADALEARGIPFVFVTGYSASSIDRRYAAHPRLREARSARQAQRAAGELAARCRGHGPSRRGRCLGSTLARLEDRVVLLQVLERLPASLEAGGDDEGAAGAEGFGMAVGIGQPRLALDQIAELRFAVVDAPFAGRRFPDAAEEAAGGIGEVVVGRGHRDCLPGHCPAGPFRASADDRRSG